MMILAGDIGGTHTRLAFFEKGKVVKEEKVYSSQKYSCLEDIIKEFLGKEKVEKACFGVAGPVVNEKANITNLPWVIEAFHIEEALQIPSVHLLNDLESNAYGIEVLEEKDLFVLHEGLEQKGNQALISAGTGLGEAGLVWDGEKHRPFACEGGHISFSPIGDEEIALLVYLGKKFGGHVSFERVVSGPGLCNIYEFLIDTCREKESDELKNLMGKGPDAKVISEWGSKGKDKACKRAVECFISIYGAAAGNIALQFLALAGVYIGGGIAPQLIENLKEGGFLSAFLDKGRFKDLLNTIPIKVILNDQAALLGAANYAENYQ